MNRRSVSLFSIATMLILFAGINVASDVNAQFEPSAQNPMPDQSSMGAIRFVAYKQNPVLDKGPAGSWDAGIVFVPSVVFKDGLYHMFYNGSSGSPLTTPVAIGYASSPDGFNFTKHESNPILAGDGTGFDAFQVTAPTPVVKDETWILYFNARSAPGPGPGPAIGRATAPGPTGPWTRDETPVLVTGSPGAWDSGFVTLGSVIASDEGYVMYYSGAVKFGQAPYMTGRATSRDGKTWTKYNDPSTTDPPYAESDPILALGPSGDWDSLTAWMPNVWKTDSGWEMCYSGTGPAYTQTGQRMAIGYATSADGIHWTKLESNPIYLPENDRYAPRPNIEVPSVVERHGRRIKRDYGVKGSVYFMYYDYGKVVGAIGVALGAEHKCP